MNTVVQPAASIRWRPDGEKASLASRISDIDRSTAPRFIEAGSADFSRCVTTWPRLGCPL